MLLSFWSFDTCRGAATKWRVVINDRICGQPTALIWPTDKPLINRLGTPKRFKSRFFKDQAASCALCTLVLAPRRGVSAECADRP